LHGVEREENDNDAAGSIRDCLAKSETTSTPPTLEAGFGDSSLFGSGIGFDPTGIVLGHDIYLGNISRWSSRLV